MTKQIDCAIVTTKGVGSVEIEINKIIPADELAINSDIVLDRLADISELIVFNNNQPQFVIMSMDNYLSHMKDRPIRTIYTTDSSVQKIGRYVQDAIKRLFDLKNLTKDELENLCDASYCTDTFGLSFPVLKMYDSSISFDNQKRDSNGYNRYYNYLLNANGVDYLLSSQWVEALHRERFERWYLHWSQNSGSCS